MYFTIKVFFSCYLFAKSMNAVPILFQKDTFASEWFFKGTKQTHNTGATPRDLFVPLYWSNIQWTNPIRIEFPRQYFPIAFSPLKHLSKKPVINPRAPIQLSFKEWNRNKN